MGSLKPPKRNFHKVLKHRHLRTIATFFQYAEFCVGLVLFLRLSIKLPMALKNSSEYFSGFAFSPPRFVFLLGNFIIIGLITQSAHFSGQDSSSQSSETDLYEEFIQNCSSYKIKEIQENKIKQSTEGTEHISHSEKISETNFCLNEKKGYRRCQSEILRHVEREKPRHMLQRCESMKNRGRSIGVSSGSYPEDGMSNDEFRRTIEAFIARQQRLRRQEQCLIT